MSHRTSLLIVLLVVAGLSSVVVAYALPAFPGAEGWGSETIGGRGGQIVFVNTLLDNSDNPPQGSTTLRDALTMHNDVTPEDGCPRIVLFRVSGNITIKDGAIDIGVISDYADPDGPPYGGEGWSYLTLDGSSAPGGGVCITAPAETPDRNGNICITGGAHDVIFRNLRFRAMPSLGHNIGFLGIGTGAYNVIVDHCSFSWAGEQPVGVGGGVGVLGWDPEAEMGNNHDVTYSNCIIAEALGYLPYQPLQYEGQATLFSYDADRVSLHHNFLTGNPTRNPKLDGGLNPNQPYYWYPHCRFDLRNNLVYNWGTDPTSLNHGAYANIVSCVYTQGPNTQTNPGDGIRVTDGYPIDYGTRLYVDDNIAPTFQEEPLTQWDLVFVFADTEELDPSPPAPSYNVQRYGAFPEVFQSGTPLGDPPPVTTVPSSQVENLVLCTAGAFPRDTIDANFVQEYWDGEGNCGARDPARFADDEFPDLPSTPPGPTDDDNDGMGDAWETSVGLDPEDPNDAWLDRDSDGYPNLEEFLHTTFEAKMPPPPVQCLTAEDTPGDDGGSITLDWSDYEEPGDLYAYFVLRSTSSFSTISEATQVGSTYAGTRTFVDDDNVTDNTDYYYAVVPADTGMRYNLSVDCVGPVQSADDAPLAVDCLTAEDTPSDEGGSISLDWSGYDEPSDISMYLIFRDTSSFTNIDGMDVLSYTLGGVQTYEDDTTTDGTNYYYAVVAIDGVTTPDYSVNCAGPVTSVDNTAPAAVTGLSAADTPSDEGGSIDLSWTGSGAGDLDGYRVYRDISSFSDVSAMTPIATRTSAQTTYTDTTTTDGTNYYYAVTAIDEAPNENTTVTCVGPVTSVDNTAPAQITGLTAADGTGVTVDLNWTSYSPPGDLVQYRIYRAQSSFSNIASATLIDTVSAGTQTYNDNDPNLQNNQWYYYAVTGYDGVNENPTVQSVGAKPKNP